MSKKGQIVNSLNRKNEVPKRDRWDEIKKLWYKFSLNKTSVIRWSDLGIMKNKVFKDSL